MKNCMRYGELISAYIDNELTESECSELNSHLSDCSECRSLLSTFKLISGAVNTPEPVPELLAPGIMYKLSLESVRRRNPFAAFGRYTAAAVILIIIAFGATRFLSASNNNTGGNMPFTVEAEAPASQVQTVNDIVPVSALVSSDISYENGITLDSEDYDRKSYDRDSGSGAAPMGTSVTEYAADDESKGLSFIGGYYGSAASIMSANSFTGQYYALCVVKGDVPDWATAYKVINAKVSDNASEVYYIAPASDIEALLAKNLFDEVLFDNSQADFGLIAVLSGE